MSYQGLLSAHIFILYIYLYDGIIVMSPSQVQQNIDDEEGRKKERRKEINKETKKQRKRERERKEEEM